MEGLKRQKSILEIPRESQARDGPEVPSHGEWTQTPPKKYLAADDVILALALHHPAKKITCADRPRQLQNL